MVVLEEMVGDVMVMIDIIIEGEMVSLALNVGRHYMCLSWFLAVVYLIQRCSVPFQGPTIHRLETINSLTHLFTIMSVFFKVFITSSRVMVRRGRRRGFGVCGGRGVFGRGGSRWCVGLRGGRG